MKPEKLKKQMGKAAKKGGILKQLECEGKLPTEYAKGKNPRSFKNGK